MTLPLGNSPKKWKKIGKIGKAHGLKGAFYLGGRKDLWTDEPSLLSVGQQPETGIHTEVTSRQFIKGRLILSLSHFNDRTSLEAAYGQDLWCPLQDVSEAFDYDAIIGFEVRASCESILGQVSEFYNHGASDTIEIKGLKGTLELPFVDAYILELDFKASIIKLTQNADVFTELWQTP